ncbi:MAG: DUF5683 domain-containing protein [Ignavibacteria bacterium]|jgi:hypothetical protein|nr:DUF5683 domain-containing protein [Ignavibacteria bacterium]MDH7528136.1 DUF5683 domain-containing protein [Ignavibacteria bacterium]NPV10345.1 hypothetical protein [Ignavibacteria bacterium]
MFKKILLINLFIITSSIFPQEVDTLNLKSKSPWGAVARSAILPGLGQFYNEAYWKVPVIWGLLGWFGYNWWQNNKNYNEYKTLYYESVVNGNENYLYKRIREFYRDQRDLFAVYLGLTYFLNLVDAYVDAQLFNFEILTKNNDVKFSIKIRL